MKKFSVLLILLLMTTVCMGVEWPISSRNVNNPSRLRRLLQSRFDNVEGDVDSLLALNQKGTGNFYYVDSGRANAATIDGKSWIKAEPTIDDAINNCTANNGDVIFVAQGHTLTKSATGAVFTADIAGVTIIGIGTGENRPKIILSHTGADIDVTADNVRISNLYLDATGVDSVDTPLNISGEGCVIDNWFFRLADSHGQADLGITIGIADGDANDLIIANCIFEAPDAGAASAITFAKDMSNVILSNLWIYGDFSSNGIDVPADGNAQVNLLIIDTVVISKNADEPAIEINGTGNTGAIINCTLVSDAEATIVDAGGLQISDTDLLVIGNAEGGVLPANMTLIDLIGDFTGPDDGAVQDDNVKASLDLLHAGKSGTYLLVQSDVTSSSIPNNTQTAGAITGASSGTLLLIDIYVNTDSTGLATPTNIEFTVDNANGLTGAAAPIALESIAGLGASKCWNATTDATSHNLPLYLETGKKVFIHGDDAAGTGAGHAYITLLFQRISDSATIAGNDGPS